MDSSASLQVMTHLRNLAYSGRTVLVIIHQPSSRLFELIDDIYLLSDGTCLYNGLSKDLVSTFAVCGFECPQYYNRSDFGKYKSFVKLHVFKKSFSNLNVFVSH